MVSVIEAMHLLVFHSCMYLANFYSNRFCMLAITVTAINITTQTFAQICKSFAIQFLHTINTKYSIANIISAI